MNALRLGALLIFTFGAFAYGAILVLWIRELGRMGWAGRRVADSRTVDLVNGALVSVSFLWFLLNIAVLLQQLGEQGSTWQVDVVTVTLAFCFPPLILHVAFAEVAGGSLRHPNVWRALVPATYAAALGIPAWCLSVFFSESAGPGLREFAQRIFVTGLSGLFVWAASGSVVLSRAPRQGAAVHKGGPPPILLYGLMVLLFVGIYVTHVVTISSSAAAILAEAVSLTARSLPLLFLFVSAYYENRFQFFDLFVKRGAGLLLAVALLTIWFAVMLPWLAPLATTWAAPWIFAIALVPIVALLPLLYGAIARALDRRWLGRQFTTIDAVTRFLAGLRAATSETTLVSHAEQGLAEIFDAPAAVRLDAGSPSTIRTPLPNDPSSEVSFEVAHETRSGGGGPVPNGAQTGDEPGFRFLLGRRRNDAPYFSQDAALVRTLAEVFASALENVHLQQRRLEEEQRARELSLHASRSELKALRAQINPHFLFNALNAIAGHIHRDPARADRTVEQLADVFRYALRGAENEWTVLKDEVDFVQAYLDVERARFGDRLGSTFDVTPEAARLRVPTMMLQTLVENAVKHGVSTVRGRAVVGIRARVENGRAVVSVSDNGAGFRTEGADVSSRRSGGYGLVNIRERLEGYFGAAAELSIDRDDARGLTVVSISFPRPAAEQGPPGGEAR